MWWRDYKLCKGRCDSHNDCGTSIGRGNFDLQAKLMLNDLEIYLTQGEIKSPWVLAALLPALLPSCSLNQPVALARSSYSSTFLLS